MSFTLLGMRAVHALTLHNFTACPIGTFKLDPGDVQCADCPYKSTTVSDSSASASLCICVLGYTGPDGTNCSCTATYHVRQSGRAAWSNVPQIVLTAFTNPTSELTPPPPSRKQHVQSGRTKIPTVAPLVLDAPHIALQTMKAGVTSLTAVACKASTVTTVGHAKVDLLHLRIVSPKCRSK